MSVTSAKRWRQNIASGGFVIFLSFPVAVAFAE
jgi:hypothetical protein